MVTRQKILVTGANGQLGKSFRDLAADFPQYEFIFLSKEDLPIHQFELLRHYFSVYHPQWLINCAAYTAVDRAESEKDLAMLVNGESVGVITRWPPRMNMEGPNWKGRSRLCNSIRKPSSSEVPGSIPSTGIIL